MEKNDNVYFPPSTPEGIIGHDPIRYAKGKPNGKAVIIVHKKFDYSNSGEKLVAKYTSRCKKP